MRQLTVRAVADLLQQERHDLVRDVDETDAEYAARSELFEALLDHAPHGDGPGAGDWPGDAAA
jgi:hypothetical protein